MCIERRNKKESYIYNKEYADKVNGYDSTERYPRSVIKFKSNKQKLALHETQKPLALCEYLIKTYTNEGDVVLDNAAGSGTTGLAAKNLNRNFIMMENDPKFYLMCVDRVK